jgi:hypothetical protein
MKEAPSTYSKYVEQPEDENMKLLIGLCVSSWIEHIKVLKDIFYYIVFIEWGSFLATYYTYSNTPVDGRILPKQVA